MNSITCGVCDCDPNWHPSAFSAVHIFSSGPSQELNDSAYAGHPFGKAGAYGIQGPAATFVKHIEGDFFNVMGFPLNAFANEISKLISAGHLQLS